MAEVKVEGPELKKLIKLSKKGPLGFAFAPGKKPDEHIFAIDRRKPGTFLGKMAKKESTGMKVAFGTAELKGKLLTLTCEQVVPTMAKTVKKYLATQKIKLNVLILDLEGNTLEDDVEDLPDDPEFDAADDDQDQEQGGDVAEQSAQSDDQGQDQDDAQQQDDVQDQDAQQQDIAQDEDDQQQGDDQRIDALKTRLAQLVPGIKAAPAGVAEKLVGAVKSAKAMLDGGQLDPAEQTIGKVEAALAKLAGQARSNDQPEAQAEGADPRALAARASALKGVIDAIAEPAKSKLMAALKTAAGMIKAGELPGADSALGKIEAAVNKLAASVTGDSDAADTEGLRKWEAMQAKLQPHVDRLMSERRGDLDAINRAFNYAKEQAGSGIFDKAMAAGQKVADLIRAAAAATTTARAEDAAGEIPKDVVPYVQSRLAWIRTRAELRQELETLKSAIDAAVQGIEGLEEVPANSGRLFQYLDGIDASLEDTLERLVEAPDGDAREALKTEARKIIEEYKSVLDTDFFKEVDNNGFVTTNIRGNALSSLGQVSTALAA